MFIYASIAGDFNCRTSEVVSLGCPNPEPVRFGPWTDAVKDRYARGLYEFCGTYIDVRALFKCPQAAQVASRFSKGVFRQETKAMRAVGGTSTKHLAL